MASFTTSGTGTCVHIGVNNTYTLTTSYPFYSYSLANKSTNTQQLVAVTFGDFVDVGVGQAAQLFVAWSVLSMFYSLIAIVVYMVFTANEEWEKVMDFLVYAVSYRVAITIYRLHVAC